MNPLLRQSATAAGFAEDAELDSKLTVFALLVSQHRNRELMELMQQYMRQDIGVCVDTCRAVGQRQQPTGCKRMLTAWFWIGMQSLWRC